MNQRSNITAAISYVTWIGFLIAMIIGDRSDRFTMHHLNQALVLNLVSIAGGILSVIPVLGGVIGWIVDIAVLVGWIVGIYRALTWSMEPLPFIGEIHLIG